VRVAEGEVIQVDNKCDTFVSLKIIFVIQWF